MAKTIEEQLREELLFVIESVSENDKTPQYGYTGKKCDLNRKGKHAGVGKRFLTPIEIVKNCEERIKLNKLV